MKKYFKQFKTAFLVSIAMFVICGFIYPMVLTGVSKVLFPHQANGSLVEVNGKVVGSSNVGQDFSDLRLFHCRPSVYNYNTYDANDKDYNGPASGSENLAPSNPKLKERIEKDIEQFLKDNPTVKREDIPADIISASGSGLDPHISVEAALVQVDRVAKYSHISKDKLKSMIEDHTDGKILGVFGEDKVNVLELNLVIAKELHMI